MHLCKHLFFQSCACFNHTADHQKVGLYVFIVHRIVFYVGFYCFFITVSFKTFTVKPSIDIHKTPFADILTVPQKAAILGQLIKVVINGLQG